MRNALPDAGIPMKPPVSVPDAVEIWTTRSPSTTRFLFAERQVRKPAQPDVVYAPDGPASGHDPCHRTGKRAIVGVIGGQRRRIAAPPRFRATGKQRQDLVACHGQLDIVASGSRCSTEAPHCL